MQERQSTTAVVLSKAKQLIDAGDQSWRDAAESIAAAQKRGATQRDIASAVGKSAAWVNQLLRWRKSGYVEETAFGAQSKAGRQRARRVHATEQQTDKSKDREEAAAARERAKAANAEATRSEAEARKAKADAAKAEAAARAERAREEAGRSRFHQRSHRTSPDRRPLPNAQRERLVRALGMLGSDQAGERDNAACTAEKLRKTLNMGWDDLIVEANEADDRSGRRHTNEQHARN